MNLICIKCSTPVLWDKGEAAWACECLQVREIQVETLDLIFDTGLETEPEEWVETSRLVEIYKERFNVK